MVFCLSLSVWVQQASFEKIASIGFQRNGQDWVQMQVFRKSTSMKLVSHWVSNFQKASAVPKAAEYRENPWVSNFQKASSVHKAAGYRENPWVSNLQKAPAVPITKENCVFSRIQYIKTGLPHPCRIEILSLNATALLFLTNRSLIRHRLYALDRVSERGDADQDQHDECFADDVDDVIDSGIGHCIPALPGVLAKKDPSGKECEKPAADAGDYIALVQAVLLVCKESGETECRKCKAVIKEYLYRCQDIRTKDKLQHAVRKAGNYSDDRPEKVARQNSK